MMELFCRSHLLVLLLGMGGLLPLRVQGGHLQACHIEYRDLGGMMLELRVVTYSDPTVAFVDRCAMDLEVWNGAGTIKVGDIVDIPRVNGPLQIDSLFPGQLQCDSATGMGEYLTGTSKRSEYVASYTFPGAGIYRIRFCDVGRLGDIINLSQSGSQGLFLEQEVVVSPFMVQHSPELLNPTLAFGVSGQPLIFDPGAWDADGDSLAFSWFRPMHCTPFLSPSPGYVRADSVAGNGPLELDAETGVISWTSPQVAGWYVIAYRVEEYRDGVPIGSMVVDQLVWVAGTVGQDEVGDGGADGCSDGCVRFWPQPARDEVWVDFGGRDLGRGGLVAWDVWGRRWELEELDRGRFSVAGLGAGVYWVGDVKGGWVRRMVVLR